MFDDNTQSQPVAPGTTPVAPLEPSSPAPAADVSAPSTPPVDLSAPAVPAADSNTPAAEPSSDAMADNGGFSPMPAADQSDSADSTFSGFSSEPSASSDTSTASGSDDLMSIKQEALQSLSPLLSHLDQTPEEKFRTTMMLIQASDDQSLVQAAYAAAKEIDDEKVRAQALLDIINEINYFSQSAAPAAGSQA